MVDVVDVDDVVDVSFSSLFVFSSDSSFNFLEFSFGLTVVVVVEVDIEWSVDVFTVFADHFTESERER